MQLKVITLMCGCSPCRLIQEEKQSTEARAEELESRVGSLEHMNLLVRGRSLERQSPELSGRSTPNSPNRDYMHKYHTVSVGSGEGKYIREGLRDRSKKL